MKIRRSAPPAPPPPPQALPKLVVPPELKILVAQKQYHAAADAASVLAQATGDLRYGDLAQQLLERAAGVLDLTSMGLGKWNAKGEGMAIRIGKAQSAAPEAAPVTPRKSVTRPIKTPAKTAKLKAPAEGRPQGKTCKLGVHGAWVHIFEKNEKCAKKAKLTDAQIYDWMCAEFPGKASKCWKAVNSVRIKFNKGGLTSGQTPALQSTAKEEPAKA